MGSAGELFTIDKNLMAEIIEAIKSLKVDTSNFEEADKWVGIVVFLEKAMRESGKETCNGEQGNQ